MILSHNLISYYPTTFHLVHIHLLFYPYQLPNILYSSIVKQFFYIALIKNTPAYIISHHFTTTLISIYQYFIC